MILRPFRYSGSVSRSRQVDLASQPARPEIDLARANDERAILSRHEITWGSRNIYMCRKRRKKVRRGPRSLVARVVGVVYLKGRPSTSGQILFHVGGGKKKNERKKSSTDTLSNIVEERRGRTESVALMCHGCGRTDGGASGEKDS